MRSPQTTSPTITPGFSATAWILLALMVQAACKQIASALSWGHDSWQIGDWLINYEGGFVRRGLAGSLIRFLSDFSHIQANYWVIGISTASFLLLSAWFLLCARGTFSKALVLSCIVLGFPAYQDCIIRKDSLGLLLFLCCLRVDSSQLPRPMALGLINLLAAAAILTHETFAFYALPALVFFARSGGEAPSLTKFFRRALALSPAGAVFLLTVWNHGTPETARAVNASWIPLWRTINPAVVNPEVPAAAIDALGWTTAQGLALTAGLLNVGIYQPAAWAMVFALSFLLLVLFSGAGADDPDKARIRTAAILLLQWIFISPLFLLGVDYGRWLFLWAAGSLMLLATGRQAPAGIENMVRKGFATSGLQRLLSRVPARDWYLLFFGVPVCWSLRHFLVASPLGRHFEIILSWL
jgi:hypothetical protein